CKNNTAVCVWPKVWEGRAERLQPRPLNNAPTGEVQQGSTTADGLGKNSASGSTPPQSSDLWPPINIPAIWQTQPGPRVGPHSQFNNVVFVRTKTKERSELAGAPRSTSILREPVQRSIGPAQPRRYNHRPEETAQSGPYPGFCPSPDNAGIC
ncbi:unnamed protein product, partial [Tetraodon nigroviridis]